MYIYNRKTDKRSILLVFLIAYSLVATLVIISNNRLAEAQTKHIKELHTALVECQYDLSGN